MPNPGFDWHAERTPLAGFRAWGPATRGANQWTHSDAQSSASPPLHAADECQQLITTKRGAVLVMLDDVACPQDVLAALQAAHTQLQRELLALRTRRAA